MQLRVLVVQGVVKAPVSVAPPPLPVPSRSRGRGDKGAIDFSGKASPSRPGAVQQGGPHLQIREPPAMAETTSFAEFVRRIRAGDAQAAEELVRQYETTIRREVRMRLREPQLRRLVDTMDICQSVLASFFVRTASGQYDLDDPRQLTG